RRARMGAGTRRALEAVAGCCPVAIITGRALSDVRARVPIRGISFVGNHGLELSIRGKIHRVQLPKISQRALETIRAHMRSLGRRYKWMYFEDKEYSLSVHYRHVPRSKHAAIRGEVLKAAKATGNLRIVHGIYVLNILPGVRRDKGTAAREMYATLSRGKKKAPVFIGDDVTDEDAFRAFRSGITIRVGKSPSSAARYYFKGRSGVDTFLRAISAATPSKA
ncbi:MAG: trehalose-phosphatase, partial [bacterium]|nr:trehalose-phosphatase [bacterium]